MIRPEDYSTEDLLEIHKATEMFGSMLHDDFKLGLVEERDMKRSNENLRAIEQELRKRGAME